MPEKVKDVRNDEKTGLLPSMKSKICGIDILFCYIFFALAINFLIGLIVLFSLLSVEYSKGIVIAGTVIKLDPFQYGSYNPAYALNVTFSSASYLSQQEKNYTETLWFGEDNANVKERDTFMTDHKVGGRIWIVSFKHRPEPQINFWSQVSDPAPLFWFMFMALGLGIVLYVICMFCLVHQSTLYSERKRKNKEYHESLIKSMTYLDIINIFKSYRRYHCIDQRPISDAINNYYSVSV